jgi:hypothetical protein
MAPTPLRYETPRVAMKVHRNHFASDGSQTRSMPFDVNTIQNTDESIKRLTARLRAAQKQTGIYRFALINALRRSRRTYTTYDDLSQIPDYEEP